MKFSIIIPTLNRYGVLKDTIDLLLREKSLIEEILIIDQSEDVDKPFLDFVAKIPIIKYFHLDVPNAPAARNFAARKATGELVLFLDDDIIPVEGFLAKHLKNYEDKSISAVTGRVVLPHEKGVFTSGKANHITKTGNIIVNWTSRDREEVNTVAGGNFSIYREIIAKAGYYDENYIGNAMREESDFVLRVVAAGYKIIFDPEAEIIHLAHKSGGGRQKSRIDWYFDFFHNEYYFFLKNFSHIYLLCFFWRKLRPILACMFFYGKGKAKALKTPFWAFAQAKKDFDLIKAK
ncbi:MAG: glycosyltransferase [Patescibacteria group bacterium]|jgi:GT2 family glycosyltransferase